MLDILVKNKNIVIIIIYAYILFNYIDEEDYLKMLTLTFMTGLLICNNKNVEGIENPKVEDIPIVQNIPEKTIPDVPGETKEPSKPPPTISKLPPKKERDETNDKIVLSIPLPIICIFSILSAHKLLFISIFPLIYFF